MSPAPAATGPLASSGGHKVEGAGAGVFPETGAGHAELDERRLQLVAEQAVALRWEILLTALTVFAVCWRDVPWPWLVLWLVVVIVLRELRAAALMRMVAARGVTPISLRIRRTVLWNLALGAANGSSALFMWQLDPTLDAVLTMILVSWGAGAVSTSATIFPAFIGYAGWHYLPTALVWASTQTWLGTGVAVLVIMFFGVQIRFAKRNLRTFEESFGIRLENSELARRLAAERSELALARDAAVRADQAKSQFLAAASHDLRQPLQAMSLNTGELFRLQVNPGAALIARDIGASIEDLRNMLDGLLEVSKLDAGVVRPHPRAVRLDRLLEGVCQSFRPAADARGLTVQWQCAPELAVQTDPELLRRILANLIDNGLKFTLSGGVRALAFADGSAVFIEVCDSGPGIADEDLERVFEDLVQLGNPERNRMHGHGLGLGIVRRLASLLDGTLDLDSEVGRGSTFRLRLAGRMLSMGPDANWSSSPCRLDGYRVLVLDDDARVRAACARVLAGLNAEVRVAGDLECALATLQDWACDVAVVDFRLGPGADGSMALRQIQALRPALPVIMVTADSSDDLLGPLKQAGVRVLFKPVSDVVLAHALRSACPVPRDDGRQSEVDDPAGSTGSGCGTTLRN